MCSSGALGTVLMAGVSAHPQKTFCHLLRNSVGMLFPKVFCVDVCELRGVSRRLVRPDVTRSPRACVRVRRFVRKNPSRRACRTVACVCDARDQRFLDGTLRAAQRGSKTSVGERCPHPRVHFRQGRVRARPVGLAGRWKCARSLF